jgi:hypothetical protein
VMSAADSRDHERHLAKVAAALAEEHHQRTATIV